MFRFRFSVPKSPPPKVRIRAVSAAPHWRAPMSIILIAGIYFSTPVLAEDTCSLLHRQTQEFSDAGQQSKGDVMAGYLDDDVIFFNEGGDRATKADMSKSGSPAPGVNRTIATTDWDCKLHGEVAVTSFVDIVEQGPPDQRDQYRYRSVETWLNETSGWKLIGSETLALAEDPPAIALDAKALKAYVGTYANASGLHFTFTRKGDALFASLNDGAEVPQKAQARDIFFTTGRGATPKIFQRDDSGRVTGLVYLRGNHSLSFKRVG